MVEDSLRGRHITEGDVLIYDQARTAPEDDAIQLVAENTDAALPRTVARVCRLVDGYPEYHATVPGYPILSGEWVRRSPISSSTRRSTVASTASAGRASGSSSARAA